VQRREFLRLLAAGAAAGLALDAPEALAQGAPDALYRVPEFGNVSLLHFTDCHAQLLPVHFREPSVNIGVVRRPASRLISSASISSRRSGSYRARAKRMRSPFSTSSGPHWRTGRSAASRISRRW
jgi:2',3'-cyclic-nucleotide 2'-phosphodiesterase (5'-nucleotidase family)